MTKNDFFLNWLTDDCGVSNWLNQAGKNSSFRSGLE